MTFGLNHFQDFDYLKLSHFSTHSNEIYEQAELLNSFANLWYPVMPSDDLKPDQLKPLYILERNLIAYRTRSGKCHILDAFCPHMGAHLGVDGSVVGEDIRCPFHSWTFNGEGTCTSVPGLESI